MAMREGFGYEVLTTVQSQAMGPILEGADVLVRAQTGAGKTLSFLLPMFERIASDGGDEGKPGAVRALVLSPVRELTLQIHQEATKLAEFYIGLRAVSMVGGVPIEQEQQALAEAAEAKAAAVLVATPGRFEDHLASTPGLRERLAHLRFVVLDEVDQLAGEFFRPAVARILGALPPPGRRQSLFFSATFDGAVRELAAETLAEGFACVDMAQLGAEAAPAQIAQSCRLVATEQMSQALWEALQAAQARGAGDFKVVVLLSTARVAEYYAEAFRRTSLAEDVFEIHSRRKQAQRMDESERFRATNRGVLFTSDVSARGLDYPGVAEVIQVGAPDSREDYLHRLGRTGRAGRAGRGLLLLHDFERNFLSEALGDQPIAREEGGGLPAAEPAPASLREPVGRAVMAEAYYSWLNHKLRNAGDVPKLRLVREAARFAASIGAVDAEGRPPRITERNAVKMGLEGIKDPALNVVAKPDEAEVALTYDVVPTADMPEALLAALRLTFERRGGEAKAVVYCITPFVAAYFAELVRKAMPGTAVFEVHSKVSKANKKKDLQSFKTAGAGILFSADASPQSLGAPEVTDVVQVGAPASSTLHSQRLHLASKAAAGRALLLLHPFERGLLQGFLGGGAAAVKADVRAGVGPEAAGSAGAAAAADQRLGARAYFSWLEHYCAERFASELSKVEAVREALAFGASVGTLDAEGRPPALTGKNAARIGVADVNDPALNLMNEA